MNTCPTSGRECLYLSTALAVNEAAVVQRDDGSFDLDKDDHRMSLATQVIVDGTERCSGNECGVLAWITAISLQATASNMQGSKFSYQERLEL